MAPSLANTQKRRVARDVETYLQDVEGSRYTDITGGLIQAAQYLREAGAANKTIYSIFYSKSPAPEPESPFDGGFRSPIFQKPLILVPTLIP